MSQIIVKSSSKTANWTANKRHKVGETVIYAGGYWTNVTGANSEPGVGVDWLFVSGSSAIHVSTKEVFTATAAQTDFVLSTVPANVDVIVDRLYQLLTIDYTLAGDTVTMVIGLDVGSKVEIRKY